MWISPVVTFALLWRSEPTAMGKFRRPLLVLALSILLGAIATAAFWFMFMVMVWNKEAMGWAGLYAFASAGIAVVAMVVAWAFGARRHEYVPPHMWQRWFLSGKISLACAVVEILLYLAYHAMKA
jgi:hypothetical protein